MFLADLMRPMSRVCLVEREPFEVIRIISVGARPAGIFPLGLGRQAVTVSIVALVQSPDEFLGVVPGYKLHRKIIPFVVRGFFAHDGLPLPGRHFVTPDQKSFGNGYLMGGLLVVPSII